MQPWRARAYTALGLAAALTLVSSEHSGKKILFIFGYFNLLSLCFYSLLVFVLF